MVLIEVHSFAVEIVFHHMHKLQCTKPVIPECNYIISLLLSYIIQCSECLQSMYSLGSGNYIIVVTRTQVVYLKCKSEGTIRQSGNKL